MSSNIFINMKFSGCCSSTVTVIKRPCKGHALKSHINCGTVLKSGISVQLNCVAVTIQHQPWVLVDPEWSAGYLPSYYLYIDSVCLVPHQQSSDCLGISLAGPSSSVSVCLPLTGGRLCPNPTNNHSLGTHPYRSTRYWWVPETPPLPCSSPPLFRTRANTIHWPPSHSPGLRTRHAGPTWFRPRAIAHRPRLLGRPKRELFDLIK